MRRRARATPAKLSTPTPRYARSLARLRTREDTSPCPSARPLRPSASARPRPSSSFASLIRALKCPGRIPAAVEASRGKVRTRWRARMSTKLGKIRATSTSVNDKEVAILVTCTFSETESSCASLGNIYSSIVVLLTRTQPTLTYQGFGQLCISPTRRRNRSTCRFL